MSDIIKHENNFPEEVTAQVNEMVQGIAVQIHTIETLFKTVLKEGEHYGVIPGTKKPSLYKPGAEKIGFMFKLAPSFEDHIERNGQHMSVISTCTLKHRESGEVWGSAKGACSTMEAKYRYRNAGLTCPECGNVDTLKRSKYDKGGDKGYYCFAKAGGCGAEFHSTDNRITGQKLGKVENPDIADLYNTVIKMSQKRAFVATVLFTCGASDFFTQDVEDMKEYLSSQPAKWEGKAGSKPQEKSNSNFKLPTTNGDYERLRKRLEQGVNSKWDCLMQSNCTVEDALAYASTCEQHINQWANKLKAKSALGLIAEFRTAVNESFPPDETGEDSTMTDQEIGDKDVDDSPTYIQDGFDSNDPRFP